MNEFAGVSIRPEDYAHLADLCADGEFPATFVEWAEVARVDTLEASSHGDPQPLVSLDVEEFVSWCVAVGLVPCGEALKAFLVIKRRRPQALRSGLSSAKI
jgi:hypothetical protein